MDKLLQTINRLRSLVATPLKYLLWVIAGVVMLWCFGVIYYLLPLPKWINFVLGIAFSIWATYALFGKRYTRGKLYGLLGIMLVICYYSNVHPTNDRNWQSSFARNAFAEFYDNSPHKVTIHNIRSFKYRTTSDFDVKYQKADYDLNDLESLDFIVVHWDDNQSIAHTMLSYGFKDGRHLVFSMETRLDSDDEQGAIPGLFKQFELICVVGTEPDLLGLRTNFRHEEVYLYRTILTPAEVRFSFDNMLTYLNYLNQNAEFYNTITHNCTTSLAPTSVENPQKLKFLEKLQILFNGYSDLYAYNHNKLLIKPGESFKELKRRSYINPKVEYKKMDENYSKTIREQ
ncbi:MAG: DUF4105 domain-containing protein [Victivallaceae bacterium]